jgi:hypothetical protein
MDVVGKQGQEKQFARRLASEMATYGHLIVPRRLLVGCSIVRWM